MNCEVCVYDKLNSNKNVSTFSNNQTNYFTKLENISISLINCKYREINDITYQSLYFSIFILTSKNDVQFMSNIFNLDLLIQLNMKYFYNFRMFTEHMKKDLCIKMHGNIIINQSSEIMFLLCGSFVVVTHRISFQYCCNNYEINAIF